MNLALLGEENKREISHCSRQCIRSSSKVKHFFFTELDPVEMTLCCVAVHIIRVTINFKMTFLKTAVILCKLMKILSFKLNFDLVLRCFCLEN